MPLLLRKFAPWIVGVAVVALAVWYILALKGSVSTLEAENAQKDTRIMELTANAQQQRLEAQNDIDARDAALAAQKRATKQAQDRAATLSVAMENSNEECFSRELPGDVLDSLRD